MSGKNKNNVCPLTGEPCFLHKQFHITDLDGEEYSELHLCYLCGADYLDDAAEPKSKKATELPKVDADPAPKAPLHKTPVTLMEFMKFVMTPPESLTPATYKKDPCPKCGWAIDDIRKHGRLGCKDCWEWYQHELDAVIRNAHGSIRHVGKVPKNWKANQGKVGVAEMPNTKEALEKKLKEAVEKEDYESASIFRDELKKLTGET